MSEDEATPARGTASLVGREAEVTIERIATGGDGVGRLADGRVVFVPFAAPGEHVAVEITEAEERFARARPLVVLRRSPERVEPRCAVFGECGGCTFQHLSAAAQLAAKDRIVADHLVRPGHVAAERLLPTRPSPQVWAFRHRMRFHARRGRLGLFRHASQELVEVASCPVASVGIEAILPALAAAVSAWPDTALELEIVDDGHTTSVAVSFVERGTADPVRVATALAGLPSVAQVVARDGTRRIVLGGAPGADGAAAPPGSFRQANPGANQGLREQVAAAVGPGEGTVLELYAGSGNLSAAIAATGHPVIAVEHDPHAVAAGERLTERLPRGSASVRFVRASVGPFLRGRAPRVPIVVMNPPRVGLPAKTAPAIARLGAERLVYVSCNPATLGRDLGRLVAEGFTVREVQPIDLFPQTAHVECVTVLTR
ncbi:MAG: class I SAM-dependent RNA methyltransferase [Deltaproteobacteria bacterium]|nr:class I SAM-dependent RNA methyltransferase [Deltaproteobacteria bacterium]